MPIVREGESVYIQYDIPKEIDEKIPDYFYFAMAGELVSIFGPHILERIDFYEYNDDGNPIPGTFNEEQSYYDLDSGTGGWGEAFKIACRKLDMMWLYEYWQTLEWHDSDIFDGIVEDRIVELFIKHDFMSDHANCYYKYLCKMKG